MKLVNSFLASIVFFGTAVVGDGTIKVFTQKSCKGGSAQGEYVPPRNCNGGCVSGDWNSVKSIHQDKNWHGHDYIFTVYTDKWCTNNPTAVRQGECKSGHWRSFSYDCGS